MEGWLRALSAGGDQKRSDSSVTMIYIYIYIYIHMNSFCVSAKTIYIYIWERDRELGSEYVALSRLYRYGQKALTLFKAKA